MKFAIVVACITIILRQFPSYQKFSDTILMSSSLLVVVLGFAFQTSLSDIIAGVFISMFKPFKINDRIILKSQNIAGTVENVTIRHTIIKTYTNSRLIIPNHIANNEIIENNNITDTRSSNFVDIQIDYESDVEKAKEIFRNVIEKHPDTINPTGDEENGYTYIYTRELAESGIVLRASVWTNDISTNFKACSEIRDELLKEYRKNNIKIPYPHTEIVYTE